MDIETKAQFSRKSEWKSQEQVPSPVDVDLSIRGLVPRAIFKDSLLDLTWRDFQVWSIGLSGMIHTKISKIYENVQDLYFANPGKELIYYKYL